MLEGQASQDTSLVVDKATADRAMPQSVTEDALKAVGAWRDLDWLEMEGALDRIRHENTPTPPVEL